MRIYIYIHIVVRRDCLSVRRANDRRMCEVMCPRVSLHTDREDTEGDRAEPQALGSFDFMHQSAGTRDK